MKKITALTVAGVFVASLAGTAFAEGTDVKISGEIRIRDEWKNNYGDFNSSSSNGGKEPTNAITQRTRVNVDAKIDERVKAYVSLENNRNWGSSGPAYSDAVTTKTTTATTSVCSDPEDALNNVTCTNTSTSTSTSTNYDSVGLYQGYVVIDKLFDQPLLFKAGRQKIALGNQRLIGANDWGPGQSFDGWILGYNIDAVSVNAFSVTGVDRSSYSTDPNGNLNGIYATIKSVPVTGIDVYAMQKADVNSLGQSFLTYGVRANGAAMNIDWDAEFALQSGDHTSGVKKTASAVWLVAGYSLPQVSKLRIGAEYDMITGDKGSSADNEGFDLLFKTQHSNSTQHSNYGITDYIENAGYGMKALSLNASAEPLDGMKLLAEYWNFTSNTGENDKALGSEINLQVWYAVTKSTGVHAYYAQFTPTSDLPAAAAKQDAATDAVLQLQVAF